MKSFYYFTTNKTFCWRFASSKWLDTTLFRGAYAHDGTSVSFHSERSAAGTGADTDGADDAAANADDDCGTDTASASAAAVTVTFIATPPG